MRNFSPKRDDKLARTESSEQRKCAKAAEQTDDILYEPLPVTVQHTHSLIILCTS